MTEKTTDSVTHSLGNRHDYLPAAGRDALLPAYDLITRLLGTPGVHAALLDQADIAADHRVLEIGCGTGELAIAAARARPSAEVVGSDPDPKALARAQRKVHGASGIRFERGYGQDLPYADATFDRVLSSMMFHHLDAEVKAAVAQEVRRVLRPGGSLHLADIGGRMTPDDGIGARIQLRGRHLEGNLGDRIPNILRAAGFDCAETAFRPHRILGRITFYRAVRVD
ncbi:methyltransferase domain-containing protein [Nocardia bovistercoris]|uniref:Methyltransferase domain-containing protein n=1 Tax=Nocardia bovistercoris TaxID=2785916 RepID=A0A931ICH0_9NOCA|nr:methyltransferase domain-containing protein [Nocardia bovistercoris]MBH0777885.1 methyltransferase domain-containing protein [Nocardia bovistercoris]